MVDKKVEISQAQYQQPEWFVITKWRNAGFDTCKNIKTLPKYKISKVFHM